MFVLETYLCPVKIVALQIVVKPNSQDVEETKLSIADEWIKKKM